MPESYRTPLTSAMQQCLPPAFFPAGRSATASNGLPNASPGRGSLLHSRDLAIKRGSQGGHLRVIGGIETTMQGLVGALIIQLLLTGIKKSEEEFLDACNEYCSKNIVGKLRIIPFESEGG